MTIFEKIMDGIHRFSKYFMVFCMAVMFFVLLIQIFFRAFLGISWTGAEELARILLVWTTFLGANVAYREKAIPAFDILERKLTGKISIVLKVTIQIIILIFTISVMTFGFQLINQPIISNQTSAGLNIPMPYLYLAVPVGMLLITLNSLLYIKDLFTNKPTQNIPKGETENLS